MEEKGNKMDRRDFFLKAGKLVIPTLGILGLSLVTSSVQAGCQNACVGTCSVMCGRRCEADCTTACMNTCQSRLTNSY